MLARFLLACMLLLAAGWAGAATPAATPPQVILLQVDGAISPASADYVIHGIRHANTEHAAAVVLEMDTPGGLATSMRDINKAILASAVPVIGYVSPAGARAASAGTYILYATHIAAMAPATNIGAATPISLLGGNDSSAPASEPQTTEKPGSASTAKQPHKFAAPPASTEMRKATNDAVAGIRALAEQRGRNADWAEQAVRNAASITAEQALKLHVIDLIAPNVTDLLAAVNGRTVTTAAGPVTLHTAGARVETLRPGLRSQFLAVIANPSVALILLLIGLGGLVMEGAHPGGIFPGVLGAICLLLALYAFQLLPVNFAGLGLMLLGVVLIVSEAFIPAYGILGVGGAIAFVVGAVILMRNGSTGYQIALPTVIGLAIAGAGVIAGILWLALRSHHRPVVSGREQMLGAPGDVVEDFAGGRGWVHVHGERWQATSAAALHAGDRVVVTALNGLTLAVAPAEQKEV